MPVNVNNMAISNKVLGKYEVPIMDAVKTRFEQQGYAVQVHRRLNIAWGNIISDVDVAASKDGRLTVIEVKSRQDNIRRVQKQYDEIKDYVNYYWIATDYMPTLPQAIWRCDDRVGHLLVDVKSSSVKVLAEAKLLDDKIRVNMISNLPRICLTRLCGISDGKGKSYWKHDLGAATSRAFGSNKQIIADVVACSRDCENNCPIWQYVKRPILTREKPATPDEGQTTLGQF